MTSIPGTVRVPQGHRSAPAFPTARPSPHSCGARREAAYVRDGIREQGQIDGTRYDHFAPDACFFHLPLARGPRFIRRRAHLSPDRGLVSEIHRQRPVASRAKGAIDPCARPGTQGFPHFGPERLRAVVRGGLFRNQRGGTRVARSIPDETLTPTAETRRTSLPRRP